MASIRADSDGSGVSPVLAFFVGAIVSAGVIAGIAHERPELICEAPPPPPAVLCPEVACPPCTAATVAPAPPRPPPPTLFSQPPAPTFGIAGPAIVNVWLENCADCMPAFAAWRDARIRGQIPVDAPVHNVVYGGQTATLSAFARQYAVNDRLSFDGGARFVQPLGIGTFTTLVLDGKGELVARMRPTDAEFAGKLGAAWSRALSR